MHRSEQNILAGIALLLVGFILKQFGYAVPFWLLALLFIGVMGAGHDS